MSTMQQPIAQSNRASSSEYYLRDLPWSTVSRARERGRRPDGLPVALPPERPLRDRLMTEVFHAGR